MICNVTDTFHSFTFFFTRSFSFTHYLRSACLFLFTQYLHSSFFNAEEVPLPSIIFFLISFSDTFFFSLLPRSFLFTVFPVQNKYQLIKFVDVFYVLVISSHFPLLSFHSSFSLFFLSYLSFYLLLC